MTFQTSKIFNYETQKTKAQTRDHLFLYIYPHLRWRPLVCVCSQKHDLAFTLCHNGGHLLPSMH